MSKLKALFCQRTIVSFLLVILLLVVQGCRQNPSGTASTVPTVTPRPEPRPTPAPRVEPPASKTPAAPLLAFTGEVRVKEQLALSAKVSGRIAELRVAVGDQVKKNDLLVVLEHAAMDAQVKQEEARLRSAEATLKGAQAQLDLLQAGTTKEQIAVTEGSLRVAEANMALALVSATKEQIAGAEAVLAAAQAKLDLLLAGPKPQQLLIAEFEIEMAKQGVTEAENDAAIHRLPYSSERFEVYDKSYADQYRSAQMQVDMAKYELELLKAPPKPEEVAQQKGAVDEAKAKLEALKAPPRSQQVAQLQATVDVVRAQLEVLKAPPRPQQVAQLEAAIEGAWAQVALAQASLSLARAQREEAFLYSPLDGVVTSRSLGAGSLASPSVPILTIVHREMEVVIAVVGEIALGQMSPGQVVSITAPPYPGKVFSGKVRAIALGASSATRTFEVYIDPQDPEGLLRPGMFLSVSLSKSEGL